MHFLCQKVVKRTERNFLCKSIYYNVGARRAVPSLSDFLQSLTQKLTIFGNQPNLYFAVSVSIKFSVEILKISSKLYLSVAPIISRPIILPSSSISRFIPSSISFVCETFFPGFLCKAHQLLYRIQSS